MNLTSLPNIQEKRLNGLIVSNFYFDTTPIMRCTIFIKTGWLDFKYFSNNINAYRDSLKNEIFIE